MKRMTTYPVICTSNFSKTVGFYEDLFGFVPVYEAEGYAHLAQKGESAAAIAIIDANNEILPPGYRRETQGMVLPLLTDNFDETYDTLYHEGLEILKAPTDESSGVRHFMVADPNNQILIKVMTDTVCTG